jgi:hypothetical protein
MKTTMKKMTLTAALLAALSVTAPAQAEDSAYVPYAALSAQVRKDIAKDFDRQTVELGEIIRQDTRAATAAAAATADAREQVEFKAREGAFWM